MAISAELANEAVAWIKQSLPPPTVHAFLVSRGAHDLEARALLDDLLAKKAQADALDPNRLRNEGIWILWRGGSVEDVVAHFVRVGVPGEHARPEAQRIEAAVQRMKPCERCRSPLVPQEAFFDTAGRQICKRCNSMNEIGAAERRVVEGALERVGVPAFAIQAANGVENAFHSAPTAPWCARCHRPSGVHVNALHPSARSQIHPGWMYVCGFCMQGLA